MDTLKDILVIRLTWRAFSQLRDKHLSRVLDEMDAGLFLFTDSSVTLHMPPEALDEITYTQIH